jgi:hypothetical protein
MEAEGGPRYLLVLARRPLQESARRMRAVAEISRPTPREWEKEKQNVLGERAQWRGRWDKGIWGIGVGEYSAMPLTLSSNFCPIPLYLALHLPLTPCLYCRYFIKMSAASIAPVTAGAQTAGGGIVMAASIVVSHRPFRKSSTDNSSPRPYRWR